MEMLKKALEKTFEIGTTAEQLRIEIDRGIRAGKPDSPVKRKKLAAYNKSLDKAIAETFALMDQEGPEHFSRENTWIWGGPTPYWGGSDEPDCAMKGAEYFDLENVVYMYGPTDENAIRIHKNAKKLICQLSSISRSPGVVCGTDEENAELISKLSLKYPNIKGGMIDDLIGNFGRNISLKEVKKISEALKKHNPDLKLYSVVYVGEMDSPFLKLVEPYVDAINLWVGYKYQLPNLDLAIEKFRLAFPGKPIMLGIFIYDYFAAANPNGKKFLEIQLKRARKYLADGKIHDLVILGDREVKKCPEESAFVKEFLKKEFTAAK